ncbi:MAG TPA: response regulator [bacterium]|nr:response regulator [bacterium]
MALNVLIVDDSAVMRSMVLKVLKMSGVPLGEVREASNGQEGLETLAEYWIDLVILDINMPVMTGDEMISRVRAIPEYIDLPMIVVSTEGSQTRIEQIIEQGVKFIHKPFSPELIRQAIQELTGVGNEQGS